MIQGHALVQSAEKPLGTSWQEPEEDRRPEGDRRDRPPAHNLASLHMWCGLNAEGCAKTALDTACIQILPTHMGFFLLHVDVLLALHGMHLPAKVIFANQARRIRTHLTDLA